MVEPWLRAGSGSGQNSCLADIPCGSEIRAFIVENYLFGQEDGLREDVSLADSGVMDSTGILELVSFIEERFGITIEDHELVPSNLDSIANIAAFVQRKTKP